MKRIKVSFGGQAVAYYNIHDAMNVIKDLYLTFYVHNPFDEWEDAEASYKLYEIEKWLNTALEQNKPSRRKLAADLAICVN